MVGMMKYVRLSGNIEVVFKQSVLVDYNKY